MKKHFLAFCLTTLLSTNLYAAPNMIYSPIQDALTSPKGKEVVDPTIRLSFKKEIPPKNNLGTYVANKRTNASNKTEEAACQIAFLSAIIALQNHAKEQGGNAVVDIHSYYRKDAVYDASNYRCDSGFLMAGVTLRGTVVKE